MNGSVKDIEVIFENESIVVINKPSGVMVHADGYAEGETVADWFVQNYPESKGVGEEAILNHGKNVDVRIDRPGIVHRLDTETSGVLVLARTQQTFAFLKRQFHDRKTKKEYRAFVYGKMSEDHGSIDRPIGRSAKDFRLRSAQRGAKGALRPSHTDWELIAGNNEFSYLRAFPKTGRTHQIRVHLKAINHSVVCDKLYAPKSLIENTDNLGFDRLALHAHTLTINVPSPTGDTKEMTFEASLPPEFLAAEQKLG